MLNSIWWCMNLCPRLPKFMMPLYPIEIIEPTKMRGLIKYTVNIISMSLIWKKTTCHLVAFFLAIFRKHKVGIMIACKNIPNNSSTCSQMNTTRISLKSISTTVYSIFFHKENTMVIWCTIIIIKSFLSQLFRFIHGSYPSTESYSFSL